RLSGEYYDLVSRKLAEAMRRPVRIEFSPSAAPPVEKPTQPSPKPVADRSTAPQSSRPIPLPSFTLGSGLTNHQIWHTALATLASRLSAATWETWVRPAALIGIDADGTLVLGAPNAFARRRLDARLLDEIARALSELLAQPVALRVVVTQEWLRERESATLDEAA